MAQVFTLWRDAQHNFIFLLVGEDRAEESIRQFESRFGRAPGRAEVLRSGLAQFCLSIDECRKDIVHQLRVGPAETVDSLFAVAHPDDFINEVGELHKDRQLDGRRVLELIDGEQPVTGSDRCPDSFVRAQQVKGANLLVDEIHHPEGVLVFLVRRQ